MFIFDAFNRQARRLQTVGALMGAGMLALLAGLWFVQIVSGKQFQGKMERQSFRTNAVQAVRGRILDRKGNVLADSRPQYNVVLNLEDLRGQFETEYTNHVLPDYTNSLARNYLRQHPGEGKTPAGVTKLPEAARAALKMDAKFNVVSNITARVAALLQQPVALDAASFRHFYTNYTYVPLQILTNLNAAQIAKFSEQLANVPGLEIETLPLRNYPYKTLAADLLGYVHPVAEDSKFLPAKYEGDSGLEKVFDDELQGQEGEDLVLVNSQNYRQREEEISPNQDGSDIWLTLDLGIQQAAEKALAEEAPEVRGAAVVMDTRTGDVLAMVSAPGYDPNDFVRGISQAEFNKLDDEKYTALMNKATMGSYPPGSTFKIITSIACMESGVLDPAEEFNSPGYYKSGSHVIDDTAGSGRFNFERAFYRSSNTYFINYGMKAGLAKLIEVARRFHLGEKTGIASRQEVSGALPSPRETSKTPDVCIGQEVTVTPLQMAVLTSAIANGGTIFRPRIVSQVRSEGEEAKGEDYEAGVVRDKVQLNPKHLEVIREAMLADTEHGADSFGKGGSAYEKFHLPGSSTPYMPNFHVAGKTGTAEIKSPGVYYKVTWFVSYAPYENPRYAVVVMVVSGASGGLTCAEPARKIYQAILKEEQAAPAKPALANN